MDGILSRKYVSGNSHLPRGFISFGGDGESTRPYTKPRKGYLIPSTNFSPLRNVERCPYEPQWKLWITAIKGVSLDESRIILPDWHWIQPLTVAHRRSWLTHVETSFCIGQIIHNLVCRLIEHSLDLGSRWFKMVQGKFTAQTIGF